MSMMRPLAALLLVSCLACSSTMSGQTEKEGNSGAQKTWRTSKGGSVFCKDTTMYSAEFLRSVREMGLPGDIRLVGEVFDDGSPEPVHFPSIPEKGVLHHLAGSRNGIRLSLDVERVNYSTIRFVLQRWVGADRVESSTGVADLSPGFILASEIDEGIDGAYGSSEFSTRDPASCLSIRIGMDGERMSAFVISRCPDHPPLDLYECPQLLKPN